jgi:hypothetical protein
MENANPWMQTTASTGWQPVRFLRKSGKKVRRYENQAERARIREDIQAGMRDPEAFLDLAGGKKNARKLSTSGKTDRIALLTAQKRKLRSELRNTRDLDTFIRKTSHSRTLYALIAMGFFHHVMNSEEYRRDHRYKLAILGAMEEPGLAKAIQRKWDHFRREFSDPFMKNTWQ